MGAKQKLFSIAMLCWSGNCYSVLQRELYGGEAKVVLNCNVVLELQLLHVYCNEIQEPRLIWVGPCSAYVSWAIDLQTRPVAIPRAKSRERGQVSVHDRRAQLLIAATSAAAKKKTSTPAGKQAKGSSSAKARKKVRFHTCLGFQ